MVGEVLGAVVMREVRGVPGEVTASAYDLCRGLCVGIVGQIRLAFWSSEVLEFRRHRDCPFSCGCSSRRGWKSLVCPGMPGCAGMILGSLAMMRSQSGHSILGWQDKLWWLWRHFLLSAGSSLLYLSLGPGGERLGGLFPIAGDGCVTAVGGTGVLG